MVLEFDMVKTMFLAIVLLYLGNNIRNRIDILVKWCIPGPVVGGLLFSIVHTILHLNGYLTIEFDTELQTLFMNLFFASTGFEAGVAFMKRAGKKVLIFVFLAALLAFLQSGLAVGLAPIVGVDPKIALMTGSIPMTGGHGNASSFGPIAEAAGVTGALSVAVAAATFGLVAGSIVGGPVGEFLIRRKNLAANYNPNDVGDEKLAELIAEQEAAESKVQPLDAKRISTSVLLLFVAIGMGAFFKQINTQLFPKVSIPIHVWGMVGGVIIRNVYDFILEKKGKILPVQEAVMFGSVSLSMFVSSAVMTMRLWELIDLAIPLIILLFAQVALIVIFVPLTTYNLMGRDYDAALMSAGHIGFGMGAVPVSVANMSSISEKYHYSKIAFFVVPVVGGLFSNFTNAAVITFFFNLLGIN